jgi:hypothetical protein
VYGQVVEGEIKSCNGKVCCEEKEDAEKLWIDTRRPLALKGKREDSKVLTEEMERVHKNLKELSGREAENGASMEVESVSGAAAAGRPAPDPPEGEPPSKRARSNQE